MGRRLDEQAVTLGEAYPLYVKFLRMNAANRMTSQFAEELGWSGEGKGCAIEVFRMVFIMLRLRLIALGELIAASLIQYQSRNTQRSMDLLTRNSSCLNIEGKLKLKQKKNQNLKYLQSLFLNCTHFSNSGARSTALDSLENPVTYNVFLGIVYWYKEESNNPFQFFWLPFNFSTKEFSNRVVCAERFWV